MDTSLSMPTGKRVVEGHGTPNTVIKVGKEYDRLKLM